MSSNAAATPNWELPCGESCDRVSEGERLGDDISSKFPAQSSLLQNFSSLHSYPPPFALAPQLFKISCNFPEKSLSYCTNNLSWSSSKIKNLPPGTILDPAFSLDSAAIVLGTIRRRSFLQNSSLLCVLYFLGTIRLSVLGNLWYGSETTCEVVEITNLQPRAAAATSGIRASGRSDVQNFTAKLATASAIPPESTRGDERQKVHAHNIAAQLQTQSQS